MTARIDLRQRLTQGAPFLFSWMTMPGAQLASQLARGPIEGVCIDLQHGLIAATEAAAMAQAITSAGRHAVVRVLWNDPGLVGHALDMGASAVIAPMVNSAAEAQALVKAAKYPPTGQRSWGGYGAQQAAGMDGPTYLAQANRITLVFAMIETAAALENVEAIAATPGLDGLFVGPSDLSIALSNGAKIDRTAPQTLAAMERIAAAAKANGLVAGAFAGNADIIVAYRKLGYTFLAAAVDVDLLKSSADVLVKAVSGV